MAVNRWMKTPKGYVVMALAAYLLIASAIAQEMKGIINGIIAVAVCLAVDIIWGLIAKRKRIVPDGAVITGLIISLILSATTSWPIIAATSAIAIVSKHIFVHRKKPIFNPAAFGLLLSILFFKTEQSWWGAFGDLPAWTFVFLLIGGYAVTNRVNKFPQVFSFLGTYLILMFIMGILNVGDASDALRPPFINAALFFAFFMLTDPPTSPAKVKDQAIFGILAAVMGTAFYGFFGGLMYLFIGLFIANLYHLLKASLSLQAAKRNAKAAGA
jgi:Na+-translocating ferredoxin:NAD+ oxidoreductase RnfD subunit